MSKTVYVKDFVDVNADDAAEGIRSAIKHGGEVGAHRVVFEPGHYRLKSTENIRSNAVAHDAGSLAETSKDCHIPITGYNNQILEGASGRDGKPATILAGHNDRKNQSLLPSILWCENCNSLTVKNLGFTREPLYSSAGIVRSRDLDSVTVEVFDGNPCYDGMGTYCMNRFDPSSRSLTGESVTYGQGAGSNWKQTGERLLTLKSEMVAAKVKVGEYLSWHQGALTDLQTYFGFCDNLVLANLRVFNSNGFCMLSESCRNIYAEDVIFKPDGNRLFTGPRDAWKLFKCRGSIEINRMYVEGVRMDGQNIHSNWLFMKNRLSSKEAVFFCKYTFAPITIGAEVEFYDEDHSVLKLKVLEYGHEGFKNGGNYYRILFEADIPEYAQEGSLCAAACWEHERYICRDSEFVNIAGAGHLVRMDNVNILFCKYKNTMNPGVLLGAELPTHTEGGHATNILVKGCEFDNCGFFPRYGTAGCIGINSDGFKGRYNKDIVITDNIFKNSAIGVQVMNAQKVYILNNTFENIEEAVVTEPETTSLIQYEGK